MYNGTWFVHGMVCWVYSLHISADESQESQMRESDGVGGAATFHQWVVNQRTDWVLHQRSGMFRLQKLHSFPQNKKNWEKLLGLKPGDCYGCVPNTSLARVYETTGRCWLIIIQGYIRPFKKMRIINDYHVICDLKNVILKDFERDAEWILRCNVCDQQPTLSGTKMSDSFDVSPGMEFTKPWRKWSWCRGWKSMEYALHFFVFAEESDDWKMANSNGPLDFKQYSVASKLL